MIGQFLEMRRIKAILWTLFVLNMVAIFIFSAQPSEVSTQETEAVLSPVQSVLDTLHPEIAGDESVFKIMFVLFRKTMHFAEFAALSSWTTLLLYLYQIRHPFSLGCLFSALYAATDEWHQTFVPGREGKVSDWLIDAGGALFGALLVGFLVYWWKKKLQTEK